MKYIGLCLVVMVLLCQVAMADIFSQLQFMKIASPTNGQSFSAGQKVTIKYVMQPLVLSKFTISLLCLLLLIVFFLSLRKI